MRQTLSKLGLGVVAHPNVAFVFPVGSNSSGGAIDAEREPNCLAKNILVVASMDQDRGTLNPFSDFGPGVRLAAPGKNIEMILPGGAKTHRTGLTSAVTFAAAQLSIYARESFGWSGAELIEGFLENRTTLVPTLGGKVEGNRAIYARK